MWQQGVIEWWQRSHGGLSKRLCYGTVTLSCSSFLSLIVLLPTYLSFNTFYECGYPLSKISLSYLEGIVGEWILAITFVLYVGIVLCCVIEHVRQGILVRLENEKCSESSIESSDDEDGSLPVVRPPWWKRVISITGILLVCFVCTSPSAIYVMLNSLPENNTLTEIPHIGTVVGIMITPFLVLCSQFIFPCVCLLSGKYEYPASMPRAIHVGSRRYLAVCTLFSTVIPFIVLLWWDGGCFSGFMNVWKPCMDNSFLVQVCPTRWADYPSVCRQDPTCSKGICPKVTLLTPESICRPSFRWGFCSCRIVEVWGPVMMQKFIVMSLLSLCTVIINSPLLKGVGRWIESILPIDVLMTNSLADISRRDVILAAHIELVIVWGLLSPLVAVLGLLALMTRTITFYYLKAAGVCILDGCHEPVYWYMLVSPILVSVIESWVFFENDFSGRELVWVTSCVVLVIAGVCLRLLWQNRMDVNRMTTQTHICMHASSQINLSHTSPDVPTDDYKLMEEDY